MKLRNLRKLEESEIRKEFDDLTAEKGELEALLADEKLRWQAIAGEIKLIREKFGKKDGARPPPDRVCRSSR